MLAPKRGIKLIAWSLALVQLVFCQATSGQGGESPTPRLCSDDDLKLTRFEDLKHVSADDCPEDVKKKFDELSELMRVENVCTMKLVTRLTKFCDEIGENNQKTGPMKRLINIAYAYGTQISNDCKLNLKRFYSDAEKILDEDDFEQIRLWVENKDLMYRLVSDQKNGRLHLHPVDPTLRFLTFSDLSLYDASREDQARLVMEIYDFMYYNRAHVQKVCENRFRPLYEKSILPIIHLTRHGFKHEYSATTSSLDGKETREKTMLWSRIVLFCDTLKHIRISSAPRVTVFEYENGPIKGWQPFVKAKELVVYEFKVNLDADGKSSEGYLKKISSPKKYEKDLEIYPESDKITHAEFKRQIESSRFEKLMKNLMDFLAKKHHYTPDDARVTAVGKAIDIAWELDASKPDANSKKAKEFLQTLWNDPKLADLPKGIWDMQSTNVWFNRALQFIMSIMVALNER